MKYKQLIATVFIAGALVIPVVGNTNIYAKEVACAKEQQAFNAIKQNREEIEDKINRMSHHISTLTANETNINNDLTRLAKDINQWNKERQEYKDYLDYLNGLPEEDKGSDWQETVGATKRTIERLGDHIVGAENRVITLKNNLKVIQTQLNELRSKLHVQRGNLESAVKYYDELNQKLILCLNQPGNVPNKHHWDKMPKQGNSIPVNNNNDNKGGKNEYTKEILRGFEKDRQYVERTRDRQKEMESNEVAHQNQNITIQNYGQHTQRIVSGKVYDDANNYRSRENVGMGGQNVRESKEIQQTTVDVPSLKHKLPTSGNNILLSGSGVSIFSLLISTLLRKRNNV